MNLLFGLILRLIVATRPKISTSDPTDDLNFNNSGRHKLEFSSSHEKFDVWPRPKLGIITR